MLVPIESWSIFFYHDAALNTGKHSSFIMNLGNSSKYLQRFLLTSLEITSGKDTGLIQNKKPMTEAMEQTQVGSYSKVQGQTRSLEGLIYCKLKIRNSVFSFSPSSFNLFPPSFTSKCNVDLNLLCSAHQWVQEAV